MWDLIVSVPDHCLSFYFSNLKEKQLEVSDIITDRHSQVRKWLKTDHPEIQHWFDVWHIEKCKQNDCSLNIFFQLYLRHSEIMSLFRGE